MNLDTLTTILVAVAPALSAIITIIAGKISDKLQERRTVNIYKKEVEKANTKVLKAYADVAIMKTKVASIEKLLLEQKEKK